MGREGGSRGNREGGGLKVNRMGYLDKRGREANTFRLQRV
jgi:hypothetical protein